MEFDIIFYKDAKGNDLIEGFLEELRRNNNPLWQQASKGIEKLRNRAYHKEPLSKYLETGLWELRIQARTDIARIIYSFTKGQIIILLHGFVKKQQKTPRSELETARKRLKEWKEKELL